MKVITLLLSIVLLSSCSASNQDSDDKSQQALTLVEKVCSGDNKLSWDERAELAAQANYLDKRWERLADATYVQAADSLIAETIKNPNFGDYPEQALAKVYESKVQYAKFSAECSILQLIDKEEK